MTRHLRLALPWMTLVVLAGAAGWLFRRNSPEADVTPPTVESEHDATAFTPDTTSQYLVIALVAEFCGPCDRAVLRDAFSGLGDGISAAATDSMPVSLVGVALDPGSEPGLRILEKLGPFDELHVGAGWLNEAAIPYLWGEHGGLPVVPSIVVLERTVITNQQSIEIMGERVKMRFVGSDAIIGWAKRGYPL